MAPHSSSLAWKIPWTEEPGGLLSIGSHRIRHDWSDLACMHALEKEMATYYIVLAWIITGTEEPGGLLPMGSHRVGHDWSNLGAAAAWWPARSSRTNAKKWCPFHFHALEKEMATHSSVLAWRIPGTGEPGGLLPMGSHRVGHNWSDLAAAAAEYIMRNTGLDEAQAGIKTAGRNINNLR